MCTLTQHTVASDTVIIILTLSIACLICSFSRLRKLERINNTHKCNACVFFSFFSAITTKCQPVLSPFRMHSRSRGWCVEQTLALETKLVFYRVQALIRPICSPASNEMFMRHWLAIPLDLCLQKCRSFDSHRHEHIRHSLPRERRHNTRVTGASADSCTPQARELACA